MPLIPTAFAALALLIPSAGQTPGGQAPAPDALTEFEAVCLAGMGTPETVEASALARGYAPVAADADEEAGSDRADPPPRVWARAHDDGETRAVAAPGRMRLQGPWVAVHRCYLAAPGNYGATRTRLAELTGVRPFRQGTASVFAWIERDGQREGVSQGSFERGLSTLMRERGLRMIMLSQGDDRRLILSFISPN